MRWQKLSKTEARIITGQWNALNQEAFQNLKEHWAYQILDELPPEYQSLRNEITAAWNEACLAAQKEACRKTEFLYAADLQFAIRLYRIMSRWHLSPGLAGNDQIWIYLCVRVFPDIISLRFTETTDEELDGSVNVNESRYWRNSSRIYLRSLWWYIHLSLQKGRTMEVSLEKTYEKLRFNTSDIMTQLIERAAHNWCCADVYREIMRYFAGLQFSCENRSELFRKVMEMNTARTMTVQPFLYKGGIRDYVRELFNYFGY